MIKAFENYTLLAGNHGRRGSIWRGPDHLLVIEGSGVLFALAETYRRIDYENIQALSLVRTQRYGWLLAAFSAPLVLMLAILLVMMSFEAGRGPIAVVTLMFGMPLVLIPFILLVVHLARGRTVRCTLQTAVQNLRLRPLTREAKAQRVAEEIARLCREHQGGALPPPEAGALPSSQAAPAGFSSGTRPIWNGSPAVIVAAFGAFLWGLILAGELFVGGAAYLVLHAFIGAIATMTAIMALVIAIRHQSPSALQAALWMICGAGLLAGFCALAGVGAASSHLQRSGGISGSQNPFTFLADLSMAETRGFGWIIVGVGVFIGVLGLAMIPFGTRRRVLAAAPPPPPIATPGSEV